ncbi:hypothetical protein TNCV_780411 [Trichonephila clavipes]|nr:hypothetical protein TNCV_780411 [Trichonephila clavipes]
MAVRDNLEFVQSSQNIIDADSDDENEMNDAVAVPASSEMRNTMKMRQLVPRLKTSSSYYPGKRIPNDNFQQDWCSRKLPFSAIQRKTAGRNIPEHKEFYAESLSGLPDDF